MQVKDYVITKVVNGINHGTVEICNSSNLLDSIREYFKDTSKLRFSQEESNKIYITDEKYVLAYVCTWGEPKTATVLTLEDIEKISDFIMSEDPALLTVTDSDWIRYLISEAIRKIKGVNFLEGEEKEIRGIKFFEGRV